MSSAIQNRGFSLIELVIVVIIIGVLGAIAIPRMSRGTEGARVSAFIAELNNFSTVIEQYRLEHLKNPADSSTGQAPPELVEYLRDNSWEGKTPIGGHWDIEANDLGAITLAVGVHFQSDVPDVDALQKIDSTIDDGNFETGIFQRLASDRYYLIIEQ